MSKDNRVAEILKAARSLLRERGAEAFLTSELAERCGISEGTIYKYFASRRDLLIQVAEEWFEEFLEDEHPHDRELPFRERLLQVIRKNLTIIRSEPSLTRFLLSDLRADPAYRSMRIYQQNRQVAKGISQILEDGLRDGAVRADIQIRTVRNMIQGCIEYQVWSYLRGEGDISIEHSAQGITDIVVRGIAVEADKPSELAPVVRRLEAIADRLSGLGA
ncbi:TetR/AcrR family transcriptional regulator [Sphingomonas floccifaciens]|uniref:TetR/AcrR family transcriptional regulator n=1 Tax=Sphingomonas floccifaciens TaxID=1844115 RepID=UPI0036D2844D